MNNRRDFLKKVALAGTSAVIGSQIEALGSNGVSSSFSGTSEGGGLIVPKSNGLKITGTFLDEISHDIPHQNWGEERMGSGLPVYESHRNRYGHTYSFGI